MPDEPKASEFVRRLRIGERLPLGDVADDPLFPFEGEIRTHTLDEPILPEPSRRGELVEECLVCTEEQPWTIWEDDRWRLLSRMEPHGLPMVAVLLSRSHHDLDDLPPELARELGPVIQRVARAIGRLDAVGRVHFNRWGDGSYHFHVWFLARPKGMWQMRGAMLAVWDDLLPKVPADEWAASRRIVAAAMAEGGGRAMA